jgi:hypothetical protein
MSRKELQAVLDWADGKLPSGEEPPWAGFDYFKLRETLEAIVSGVTATAQQTETSPPPEEPAEGTLLLVVANHRPGSEPDMDDGNAG